MASSFDLFTMLEGFLWSARHLFVTERELDSRDRPWYGISL